MTVLVAEASVTLDDPERLIREVCAHLAEHDGVIGRDGPSHVCTFPFGTARLTAVSHALHLRAQASDLCRLQDLRMTLATHVEEFAGVAPLDLTWSGDGSALTTPPNFRILRVEAVRDLTPRMRRLVFSGDDLERYMGDQNIHVRLLLPEHDDRPAEWPALGPDGLVRWPGGNRLASRRYTVTAFDQSSGTLAIDFVRHADAGPGSAFAEEARPGDVIGMLGPGGGGIPRGHDWYLLAGDETALPAIARILASLPAEASGIAYIEVASLNEVQPLAHASAIEICWIVRDRDGTAALVDRVRDHAIPHDRDVFVWVGCEFEAYRVLRSHIQSERRLEKDHRLVVSYWRLGEADEPAG